MGNRVYGATKAKRGAKKGKRIKKLVIKGRLLDCFSYLINGNNLYY